MLLNDNYLQTQTSVERVPHSVLILPVVHVQRHQAMATACLLRAFVLLSAKRS